MKTSELTGEALDRAVGKAMKLQDPYWHEGRCAWFSTDWAEGGPIIERERIDVLYEHDLRWIAVPQKGIESYGPTPLIAAMRCYVASVLGDTVDIPEELT